MDSKVHYRQHSDKRDKYLRNKKQCEELNEIQHEQLWANSIRLDQIIRYDVHGIWN